ncbi:hypothetical protein AZF37_05725 [endosymbiont 'TC1' of Trimyema compressum]|uniref:DNA polymerase III subunit delta n=1 Tax=endosymbiont 'TC1' of Trimyema compressum TaxID=243899 RepID=UPI0007F15944|nr:DNA polymerase III subunit delta [endosymbiont 'TC1' of Trimyema compressum]AMP20739.1 hypothetical protein AZF37_05725 [endosymbiont 'TC1' of Trimyema compressum]
MFKPLYFFHGENEFQINKKIHEISEKYNLTEKIMLDEMGFPEVIMNLNTPSLFEGQLLYIVRDEAILKDDEGLDVLINYINNPSPFACLVLAFPKKVDMRKKIPKYLKKEGFETVFSLMKPRELEKWIKEYFWKKGYDITEDTRYFLIEALGDDQILLESEMEKVCLYGPEEKKLTIDSLKDVIAYSIKGNVFQILDGLMEKNGSKMIQSLDALYKLKEPEVKIIFMVIREFRLMLLAKWLVERRGSKDDLIKSLKVHPFVGGRLYTRTKQFSFTVIKSYLNRLYELEEKIKTGKGDSKILLTSTLMAFCNH